MVETIAKRRTALGISQKDLARELGIHWHTSSKIEKGSLVPSLQQARVIADLLGWTVEQVMLAPPSATQRREVIRVAIRDGKVVHIKRCHSCGRDRRVDPDPSISEFGSNGRKTDGTPRTYATICRDCDRDRMATWRDENRERSRQISRETYRRIRADPEREAVWLERQREAGRRYYAKHVSDETRRAARERVLEHRRRKMKEDPTFFTAARRKERSDELAAKRQARDHPRVSAAPFRAWLYAYSIQKRLWADPVTAGTGNSDSQPRMTIRAATIADELGLNHRRAQSVMFGDQDNVELDIVDRAILASGVVVTVDGRDIWSIDDLYEMDFETLAA